MMLPEDLRQSLIAMELLSTNQAGSSTKLEAEPLTGGVASDIWRVELEKTVCVKRALEQLKVSQEWRVPVSRNAFEVAWFKKVATITPQAVPAILGHDSARGVFAMDYWPPENYPVWKTQLHNGLVDAASIQALAIILAKIHQETAGDLAIANEFDTDDLFYSIRIEPYLIATAEKHTALKTQLHALARSLILHKKALVHGDFSPKNILIGPQGPIVLDAECAWYGDPVFDVAFCLNHLLLKCLWTPSATAAFVEGAALFLETYLARVDWEPQETTAARVASLLPALMLARIDGKSPVEYISDESDKNKVRQFSIAFLQSATAQPEQFISAWAEAIK